MRGPERTMMSDWGCATRGTFIVGKDGNLKWQVVNSLGEARNVVAYKEALAAL